VLLVPVILAGWVNEWLGGPGALVVSLLLPLVLVADLAFLLLALGAVTWPLMPVAVAAECGDRFDALARSYPYFFQRAIWSLVLTSSALALAVLPLGAAYNISEQMSAWLPVARLAVFFLAAGLSASIFWSLETLVYLHLRAAIDGVDGGEVAVEP